MPSFAGLCKNICMHIQSNTHTCEWLLHICTCSTTLKCYLFKFVNSGYLDITIFENKYEFLSKTLHTLHKFNNKRDKVESGFQC